MKTKYPLWKRAVCAVLFILLLNAVGLTKLHAQNGALNGVFTVNANGDQVRFSQGNLQYQASTNTWRFAEHQWDYVGGSESWCGSGEGTVYENGLQCDNSQISSTYSGWIDLFGWGTSGWNNGNLYYQPWNIQNSGNSNQGYGYGPTDGTNYTYDLTGEYANADWGVYNAISNGGNQPNLWRTLTSFEWNYVLNGRQTASGRRYVGAIVNGVIGYILLPDNWSNSTYMLNNGLPTWDSNGYDENIISAADWTNILEANGAVFLPTAGCRQSTMINLGGTSGYYWSASSSYYTFTAEVMTIGWPFALFCEPEEDSRYLGFSVRLVQTMQATSYIISTQVSPVYGGTVTGAGTYEPDETCTLTAIPNEGYTFVNWTENGETVSTDSIYSFQVITDRQLVANFSNNNVGNGLLNGVFSVSENVQVSFSQGNLQYIGSASTPYWKFAEHQWDYLGTTTGQNSNNQNVDRDLFGWGTSGYDHGAVCFQPWSTNVSSNSYYYVYGDYSYNLYDQTGQADWGYNMISNGDNQENSGWRTLTQLEWTYLFDTRNTASGIRWAKAMINNVGGIILLPDNWASSIYVLNDTNGGSFNSNIINAEDWNNVLEANGAVFLPAAGDRYGTTVRSAGSFGTYWSSSYYNNNYSHHIGFISDALYSNDFKHNRYDGYSVRLVKTVQATSYNINAEPMPIDGGTILGTGQYDLGQNCTLVATPNEGYTFVNWTENGEVVSTNASYSFTVTGDRNLVANFAIAYFFNTNVDEDVYPMNTAIPIHGTVTSIGNAPVANLEVEIGITVMDWKRTLQAITNENGQFTATFEPLPLESGYYTINSGLVGNNSTEIHDSFDIMGMTILEKTIEDMQVVNDYWILCDVVENIPKTGLVKIINRNSFALTNIQVNVLSAPTGCEFTFVPMDLAGLSEGYLSYTALGTIPTQGYEYQEVRLKATCDQGAEAMFTIWFYCEEAWGTLEVSPNALNTTMTRGKSKTLDITLTNNGTSATGAIAVSLPNNLEWMSVVGGTILPSIAVNESATFTLRLSPSNDLPLGQYTGTIGINCEHGDGVTLPYTITAVSDENGALVVDVTDEFTTNTNDGNGPHVEGAEVTVTGYYSHETVTHGYTDANGTFSVSSLPEGYYTLNVQASGHSGYENNIYVDAGVTKEVNVFLQYQGVTYSWHVEPTEIQDEYTIVLNMEFEVNVPIPVVTLGAPQRIPEFEDTYTFNYVITNHGLIDALNLTLYTPENEYYLFTALYDHIDTLHAQSTVEIPCVVTRKSNLTIGCGEWALSRVQYSYLSGEELMYNQAIAYTLLSESASCNQNLPSLGGGYGGYIGGGGYGGGSGSGGSGGGSGSGGGGGTGTGGHGAPSHPGHGGHGGGWAGNGDFSTPLIINQIPNVNVQVGVQFSQRLTMTREAFIGTFAVHNGHATNAVTGIGLDFVIKDEEGNDRTNLFQISVDTLINGTGIDGNGTLAAGTDGMVKILFIPTREAAPTDSIVYSFGGTFTFVDPWSSVSHAMNLYPTYLTVHPGPDLHIDYFVASTVYGDNLLTPDVIEPSIPAELAVRIWNKGVGTAKNVILETAKPVIVNNEQGLLGYNVYINGVNEQIGLDSIVFGNIESGQTKVGEWLFTCSYLGNMVSYNAQVIHNNSYGNPKLSLVSHVGIHSLTHAIRSQANRTDDINDFLVDDVPDENNYPDSIYFSNGGKTSVGVVGSISFDHYVSNHDTIVTLTVNPSRIGWNYGETEDPGRNRYELVSCIRNNDNQVIPLSNIWQEAMIVPNSGDSLYENKLRIVDTVSVVQTYTYTLVYAGIPSDPYIFFGNEDEYWSNAANWEGNAMPPINGNVLIDGSCLLDEDATVSSLTIIEGNTLTIPDGQTLTVSNNLTNTLASGLVIEEGGQLMHANAGTMAIVQKPIEPYTTENNGWYLIASPLTGNVAMTSVDNLLENEYDLYYYDEPTYYWMNQKFTENNFTELENGKGYLYANDGEVTLEFAGELQDGSAIMNVPLSYTANISLSGFNLVGNPFVYNLTSYASVNVANGCYQLNESKDDLIVNEISEENPLKPAEGFFVKATNEGASITFNQGRGETTNRSGSIRVELLDHGKLIDRLIVKMEGEPLEKMSLKEQRTKVFATQNHQEIAIVPCEGNEQPINFKAAKNGSYTIAVKADDMEFDYLHLIDNLTGNDVNLLSEPNYTFEASTTDYASRFMLRFILKDGPSTGSGTFAFINNGNLIIIGAEAGSTLQIVDMLGHIVRSGDAMNRISTGGMTKGVYVLRLINGDDVKTQKIVID